MQYTLLDLVQIILSSMDSDEVNSVSDTVESNQVALLLKTTYYDMAVDLGLLNHEKIFELNASIDVTKPVLMTTPTNVAHVASIKYNNKADTDTVSKYLDVSFVPLPEFLLMQRSLDQAQSNVASMTFQSNGENFEISYLTDRHPTYFTDIGGSTLLFDSYNSSVDSTLQKSKTMCLGSIYPEWEMTDDFVPELDPAQAQYYLNRAKVRAFAELKQAQNQDAAQEARRQKIVLQKRDRRINIGPEINRVPKYGRR